MIVRIGDKGPHVKEIQKALNKAGFYPYTTFDEDFGPITDECVRNYQRAKGLVVDGRVGKYTLKLLGIDVEPTPSNEIGARYKGVTFKGSEFPDKPINTDLNVRLNPEMVNEYLPALERVMGKEPKGFKLLCTIMAYKEGFRKNTRSYKTKNPGNIGNTDSGANKHNGTLEDGIRLQKDYITKIANGTHKAYPMGQRKLIKPYYSAEIAKHTKLYGMEPHVPGYDFIFTGQLDQFVKIYATAARAGNGYLSMILSYFKSNGIELTPQSKIQDIIKLDK